MTERDPEILNEDEAARVWHRAAHLQAEAARKAEALAEDGAREEEDVSPIEGYAISQVRSAALSVGIGDEFVDAALADLRTERALPQGKRGWSLARTVLRHPPDTITVRRVIEATAPEVVSAMQVVFPRPPYRLTLTDQQGDPLIGGVLVFDIQGYGAAFPEGLAREASWSGLRRLYFSLRTLEGDAPSCEVTLRGPVAWSSGMDLVQGGIVTVLSGGLGVGLGAAGAAAAGALSFAVGLGPVAAVLAAVVGLGGLLFGGSLGVRGYRALYNYCILKGRNALEGLLGAVAGRAQGAWAATPVEDAEPRLTLPSAGPGT